MHVLRVHKKMGAGYGSFAKGGKDSWKMSNKRKLAVVEPPTTSLEEAINALEIKRDALNEVISDLRAML
jgi:hypothetical protein